MKTEVTSDGVTVWVNGEFGLLGRFGRQGVDIHRPLNEQSTKGECLFCTHRATTRADWDTFVKKMAEIYKVRVGSKHMPKRFKGNDPHEASQIQNG